MTKIDKNKLLSELTVEEFLDLNRKQNKEKEYVYGLKGLAKLLGCSRSKASIIKQSGIIDDAIYQNGNLIIIDKEEVLNLIKANELR